MKDSVEPSTSPGNPVNSSTAESGSSRRAASSRSGLDLPKMGAEVGFQVVSDDDVPPFRASGLICLVLGLLSASAMVAWQMLILPLAAIAFGVFALRKWSGRRPAGTTAAVIGLLLASCFAAGGLTIPLAKHRTMAGQAEYFARQYLELIGRGDTELALELRKQARNRQVESMNLKEAYRRDEVAKTEMEREEEQNMEMDSIQLAGPNIPWELAQTSRVYMHYGQERVETVWIDPTGKIEEKVRVELQWTPDERNGLGNWHVYMLSYYREVIYAPSVL
ncbi:RnfABCDGE type electron transport complex subunit D [Allorhodopirellula solitaria]|uniref:DUF4190 domain-containing protein n=1 Tax=Allorhodopirellula solitaria TaxID=2527987 RepID=A0A5C5X167_9BACT|nr:RnfABCDGE type electron transport complex subunit D [Allorhodopirellula solitaria]TWT55893.1 hypothetical protein CA85_47910 [Allorhodopirellula solitaria]